MDVNEEVEQNCENQIKNWWGEGSGKGEGSGLM